MDCPSCVQTSSFPWIMHDIYTYRKKHPCIQISTFKHTYLHSCILDLRHICVWLWSTEDNLSVFLAFWHVFRTLTKIHSCFVDYVPYRWLNRIYLYNRETPGLSSSPARLLWWTPWALYSLSWMGSLSAPNWWRGGSLRRSSGCCGCHVQTFATFTVLTFAFAFVW